MKEKIRKILSKKYIFPLCYSVALIAFSVFVLLDGLVLEKGNVSVEHNASYQEYLDETSVIIEENRYEDNNIKIEISYDRYCDSDVYIADVILTSSKYFRTAFAKDEYGKNIVDVTSSIATNNNAIFAVNGDYFGFRDYGFVYRNGVLYRDSSRTEGKDQVLIFYSDGSMNIANERATTVSSILEEAKNSGKDIEQIFSFGPSLIVDGQIVSSAEEEDVVVNPRTAIGMVEPLHYKIVCVDGRSEQSSGITIEELAYYMQGLNCSIAYNLDGGSSSTMYFNGRIVNKPSNGFEREVSDIVYIGY